MKKVLWLLVLGLFSVLSVFAQNKGRFETHDIDNAKLHVYYTNDALGDISYIIEGRDGLVTLEQPLFKDNVAEFDAYLAKLNKPVVQRIADYHVGGTADHPVVMPEGMFAFTKGEIYSGMMKSFAQAFGDAITPMPTGKVVEVPFGATQTWAGVPFVFSHGAKTDFPAASILIGKKVYYMHWAPAKAHVSHLQVSSPEAIDAEIAACENAKKSGATLFIGSHGAGVANADLVNFKISYLKKMKELRSKNKTADAFVAAMKKAYPDLPGADGLDALAQALYK